MKVLIFSFLLFSPGLLSLISGSSVQLENDIELKLKPSRGHFLAGHEHVFISGPSFNDLLDTAYIVYDDQIQSPCHIIDEKHAACELPLIDRIGELTVKLVMSNGLIYNGHFTITEREEEKKIVGVKSVYSFDELDKIVDLEWTASDDDEGDNEYELALVQIMNTKESQLTVLGTGKCLK